MEDAKTSAVPNDRITLKVRSQEGNELVFKIKKNTELKKLMDNYCSRLGITATS